MKGLFTFKIASNSTNGTYSPNILRLFYDQRAIVTLSPDEPSVSSSVSESSSWINKVTSVPFGHISLSNKQQGDCSGSPKIGGSCYSLSSLKWNLRD
jgi:hypothetical protein